MTRQQPGRIDYEIVVVGGGPAGCSAALTAHSLGVSACIVERNSLGGQIKDIVRIDNLLGGPYCGQEFAEKITRQIGDCKIPILSDEVILVERHNDAWRVECKSGEVLSAHAVIAATGSRELRLREHGLISHVDPHHKDTFVYDAPVDTLMQSKVIIIGSDRTLITLFESHGASLRRARILVSALPEKWYVLESYRGEIPCDVVRVKVVEAVYTPRFGRTTVEYVREDEVRAAATADLVLTNLGKRPNSDLFVSMCPHDDEGYLTARGFPGLTPARGIYAVGDVGHKAFQRISVAIGDGAYAALHYVYERDGLYAKRP